MASHQPCTTPPDIASPQPSLYHPSTQVRVLLSLPSQPVVIFVEWMLPPNWETRPLSYESSTEEKIGALLSYYNIPVLSMRNALWHLQVGHSQGMTHEYRRDSDGTGGSQVACVRSL